MPNTNPADHGFDKNILLGDDVMPEYRALLEEIEEQVDILMKEDDNTFKEYK